MESFSLNEKLTSYKFNFRQIILALFWMQLSDNFAFFITANNFRHFLGDHITQSHNLAVRKTGKCGKAMEIYCFTFRKRSSLASI